MEKILQITTPTRRYEIVLPSREAKESYILPDRNRGSLKYRLPAGSDKEELYFVPDTEITYPYHTPYTNQITWQ